MNHRLTFLAGQLSGVALGAMLVSVYFVNQPCFAPRTTITPASDRVVVPVNLPPQHPDGWDRREFDGRPYYIIPLAASAET